MQYNSTWSCSPYNQYSIGKIEPHNHSLIDGNLSVSESREGAA